MNAKFATFFRFNSLNECDICDWTVDKGARHIEDYDYVCNDCWINHWEQSIEELDHDDFENDEEFKEEKRFLFQQLNNAILAK